MKIQRFIFLLLLIIFTISCVSITVKRDYDPDADFAKYKTFDWLHRPEEPVTNARQAFLHNPLLEKRVKKAVEKELAGQGYQKQSENPDFFIASYTGITDKVRVDTWGYGYWRGYHGRGYYGSGDVSIKHYKEGTLIIDFIDSKTKQLFWRGWAVGVVGDIGMITEKPEEAEEKINTAVKKILERYPP